MIRAVHSLLIVTLVLTGLALGAARGQARIAGHVIICSGDAVRLMTVDRDGKPVSRPDFCPDMALSLLAAVAATPPDALPLGQPDRAGYWPARHNLTPRPLPGLPARGPPALLS